MFRERKLQNFDLHKPIDKCYWTSSRINDTKQISSSKYEIFMESRQDFNSLKLLQIIATFCLYTVVKEMLGPSLKLAICYVIFWSRLACLPNVHKHAINFYWTCL